jgi:hypothetical protein
MSAPADDPLGCNPDQSRPSKKKGEKSATPDPGSSRTIG